MTTKPKIKRVYVTATDAATRKSKATTIYDATPQQVIDFVEDAVRKVRITDRPSK
jgi:hypothetical protein